MLKLTIFPDKSNEPTLPRQNPERDEAPVRTVTRKHLELVVFPRRQYATDRPKAVAKVQK